MRTNKEHECALIKRSGIKILMTFCKSIIMGRHFQPASFIYSPRVMIDSLSNFLIFFHFLKENNAFSNQTCISILITFSPYLLLYLVNKNKAYMGDTRQSVQFHPFHSLSLSPYITPLIINSPRKILPRTFADIADLFFFPRW